MNRRQTIAQVLVGLGCLNMLAGAALHLLAGYPRVKSFLAASNLSASIQEAMRAVFLMIGCMWIMVVIVTLIAAFTKTRIRKTIVVFCGLALLAQIPIWAHFMGWFIGNEMFLVSAALITCGGLLFPPIPSP